MHPDLKDISPDDFAVVIEFLRTNMYTPTLVEAPTNCAEARMFVLEGLAKEVELADEIQRCGRRHVLAKRFGLPSMVDYVFKRLTQVRYPKAVLRHGVLLELARTVFGGRNGEEREDGLEGWLIAFIVENLEVITMWRDTCKVFWEVMHASKGLSVRIFKARAELDEKFPDLIKVEDD